MQIREIDWCHSIAARAVRSTTPCRLFYAGITFKMLDAGELIECTIPVVLSYN